MPTFDNPVADADELREAARGLAHTTRQLEDPRAIYSIVGSLSASLASLAQVLHQIGTTHDMAPAAGVASSVSRDACATSYQVAWELHRAAEMIAQVGATIERAHQLEAAITYDIHAPLTPTPHYGSAGLTL